MYFIPFNDWTVQLKYFLYNDSSQRKKKYFSNSHPACEERCSLLTTTLRFDLEMSLILFLQVTPHSKNVEELDTSVKNEVAGLPHLPLRG